jgi:hypothetical protein
MCSCTGKLSDGNQLLCVAAGCDVGVLLTCAMHVFVQCM